MAVDSSGQQLCVGDQDAEGLGKQGDDGEEFDFHDRGQDLQVTGRDKGAGAKVRS